VKVAHIIGASTEKPPRAQALATARIDLRVCRSRPWEPHPRHNQHFQQRGRLPNISGDGNERFGKQVIFLGQRVKTLTHLVELTGFPQDRI